MVIWQRDALTATFLKRRQNMKIGKIKHLFLWPGWRRTSVRTREKAKLQLEPEQRPDCITLAQRVRSTSSHKKRSAVDDSSRSSERLWDAKSLPIYWKSRMHASPRNTSISILGCNFWIKHFHILILISAMLIWIVASYSWRGCRQINRERYHRKISERSAPSFDDTLCLPDDFAEYTAQGTAEYTAQHTA